MAGNVKIDPKIAKDPAAAQEYNKLLDKVYSSPYRIIDLPDGTQVNMLGFKQRTMKMLEPLGAERVEELMEEWEKLHKWLREMAIAKRKAFKATRSLANPSSLLENVKSEVLEMYGRLYSEHEIQKYLADKGMPVNIVLLHKFRQRYKTEIERLQHEYEIDWRSVSISRKRSRLDQLSYIYNKHKQEFDNHQGDKTLPYSREMRAILEQVRKEVEGDLVKLTLDGKLDITSTIEINKSTEELYSSINFMSLLIGRVAARFNLNPAVLHFQLMNSWYSKFTGVKRNDQFKELTPQYPSAIVYNWDEMRKKNEAKNEMYDKIAENVLVPEDEQIEAKVKKDKMKEILMSKIRELDNSKVKI